MENRPPYEVLGLTGEEADRFQALPIPVQDYLQTIDEAKHSHDGEHKAQLDEVVFGLSQNFTPEITKQLGEFIIFRNSREGGNHA